MTAIRSFYAGCARSKLTIGMVYLEDDEVKGFVLGSVYPQQLRQEAFRKKPIGTLLGIMLGVVRHPSSLPMLVRSIRDSDEVDYDRNAAELIYIAVLPDNRGSGIGAQLIDAFTEHMRDAGVWAYELSVDESNKAAAAFYERRGFVLAGSYSEFGAMHRRYRLEIK